MLKSPKGNKPFDPAAFLSSVRLDRKVIELEPEESFYTQGTPADSVYCLQKGRAKLSVLSPNGKQAIITLLAPGNFFGEESLGASEVRTATVTALNTCVALKISRGELMRVMRDEPAFCEVFLSIVVARTVRTQADLADQIFNCSEKRLARALLLMAEFGKPEEPKTLIPPVTQEVLAEMVGTTRSRVSFFMNRFRNLGLIDYKGRIQVHRPRLEAILLDWPPAGHLDTRRAECTI